jgi:sec-independent protein translocase protein TatB
MFDIGFTELILIGVVGLLVIGPERLPGAIRTGAQWLSHFKRSFGNIKREIEQEMDIGAVKRQVLKANEEFKNQTADLQRNLEATPDIHSPAPGGDNLDETPSELRHSQGSKDAAG